MVRNLCDDCKECEDNDKSMSYCFDVCGIPLDILHNVENERNEPKIDIHDLKPSWISVEIQLPIAFRKVLVTRKTKSCALLIEIAYHDGDHWRSPGMLSSSVTAWMPLPRPYGEE